MSLQDDVEVLRAIPLFSKIEPAKLKLLAFTSEHLEFEQDEVLFRQGEPGDAAYIILRGTADIVVDSPTGPVTVAHLARNDVVGEIAILCDVPRTATVVAGSGLATLRVGKDAFFNLVTQFPQVGLGIMSELAHRLHQTTMHLTEASARLRQLEQGSGPA
ncbi:MAG TPA: Crp/Fnr family transcriptional regulator [Geminicoccus sp.]|uniref:cyclic nucleotide-binding domain-containing protein n=1 Tax=Geminicoccus sp. TaxID=2024832 RepID=UPI002B85AE09|nr:Crp/Fnr family transcriptional regulator [Geminicoccus sp.]HWL71097.1 Crp/Fnr family transcriptional regulator [Geminicoccus sp.]